MNFLSNNCLRRNFKVIFMNPPPEQGFIVPFSYLWGREDSHSYAIPSPVMHSSQHFFYNLRLNWKLQPPCTCNFKANFQYDALTVIRRRNSRNSRLVLHNKIECSGMTVEDILKPADPTPCGVAETLAAANTDSRGVSCY